ncbi:MAG: hypothetical protein ACSLFK_04865 [Gemmatimonadaceae bacterium]
MSLKWSREDARMVAFLVLLTGSFRLVRASFHQLTTPLDLAYESALLSTIEALRAGKNIYAYGFYAEPPFGLTMYTPLYHHVVALFPLPAANPFLPGRIVGLACMVGSGLLLMWVTPARRGRIAAVIALGLFFLLWVVTANAATVKNDSIGLLFSAGAVIVIGRRAGGNRDAVIAALLASLAFASKQSFIAAPVACWLFLLHSDLRAAMRFAAYYAGFMTLFLGGGALLWGEGFWFSIFSGGRHPTSASELWSRVQHFSAQRFAVLVAIVSISGTAATVYRRYHRSSSPFPLYAATSWLLLAATLGKMGSATNYFLEPLLASLILGVWCADRITQRTGTVFPSPRFALALCIIVAGDYWQSKLWHYSTAIQPGTYSARQSAIAERRHVLAPLGDTPRLLNLAHAHYTSTLPGEVSLPDVFLYATMWRTDQLDEDPVVRSIRRRYYDAIVTTNYLLTTTDEPFVGDSWNRVREAAVAHYPCRKLTSGAVLMFPAGECDR